MDNMVACDSSLICNEYGETGTLTAHIIVGIVTIFHAVHSIPMWASIRERTADQGDSFIALLFGGLLSFGLSSLLWPFTFFGGEFASTKPIYTYSQIWVGGLLGWTSTIFNIIWFIINELDST